MVPEILLHTDGACDLSPVQDAGSVLRNHDPNQIIGVPVEVSIDPQAKKGRALIRFGNTQIARDAFQDVKDGILRGVSFGYEITSCEQVKTGEVSASGINGPALVATRWRVHEITLTPIPADPDVGVGRSHPAGAGNHGKDHAMKLDPKVIRAMVRAAGLPVSFAEEMVKREFSADEIDVLEAEILKKKRSVTKAKSRASDTEIDGVDDDEKDELDGSRADNEDGVEERLRVRPGVGQEVVRTRARSRSRACLGRSGRNAAACWKSRPHAATPA